MSKKALVLITAPLCLFAATAVLNAWDSEGHMAAADVAYRNLEPEVKQRAIALVKLNPNYEKWVSGLPQKARNNQALVDEMTFMLAATGQMKSRPMVQDSRTMVNHPQFRMLRPTRATIRSR